MEISKSIGAVNCGQCVLDLKFLFSNDRLDCDLKKIKDQKDSDTFSQPSLIIFTKDANNSYHDSIYCTSSHITLQPKTGCPLKISRVEPGQYQDGRPPGKTRLLLEEVLVRQTGGAHPVFCVDPNAPV